MSEKKQVFSLGNSSREQAKKSLHAISNHVKATHSDHHDGVYLVINCKTPLVKKWEYTHTPRIIPLTHKLRKLGEKSLYLITKDSPLVYREELMKKGSPTEDMFNEIVSFAKIKALGGNKKRAVQVIKENDIILGDVRIYDKLPHALGDHFYSRHKRVPYVIQMAKPLPPGQARVKSQPTVDPKYVKLQIKSILANTSFIPPATGGSMTILVGYADWKTLELLANIDDVMRFLMDKKFAPIGGLVESIESIHSVHVKATDSIALPVLAEKEEDVKKVEQDGDSDSEFDFD